jgi:hypothetical protein
MRGRKDGREGVESRKQREVDSGRYITGLIAY